MSGKLKLKLKLKAQGHPKYPFQRVEQKQIRRMQVDKRSLAERQQMERQAEAKISIGTFNLLPPKPDTKVSSFTLAFGEAVSKPVLYGKLREVFGDYWDGEPTRSVYVHLAKPISLKVLREKLKENFGEASNV